jgi:hypothetical protein
MRSYPLRFRRAYSFLLSGRRARGSILRFSLVVRYYARERADRAGEDYGRIVFTFPVAKLFSEVHSIEESKNPMREHAKLWGGVSSMDEMDNKAGS